MTSLQVQVPTSLQNDHFLARGSGLVVQTMLDPGVGRTFLEVSPALVRRSNLPSLHPVAAGLRRLPRHPIVLVHGFLGFDIGRLSRRYFRGVRELLESLGCTVYVLTLPATATVAVRAAELARQIREIPERRVNIVAHSMGGLDARYAVAKLGLVDRVASLVTLGTPHLGTPIADLVEPGVGFVTGHGLHDLTTASAEDFNIDVRNRRNVFYGSIVGASTSVQGCLAAGFAYLRRIVGPNDGLVPASSQRWGTVFGEVDADHLAQIGWSRHYDTRPLYGSVITQLAAVGC